MASSPFSLAEPLRLSGAVAFGLALSLGCVGDAPTVVECVLGTVSCGGRCVDTEQNPAHCGACGRACALGESCEGGACTCLGASCGDACVELSSHPAHCGACDAPCSDGSFCRDGLCTVTCSGALTSCSGACVDTSTHREHCGGCDRPCPIGAECHEGACACRPGLTACGDRCVELSRDAAHCGDCDTACGLDELCETSSCVLACRGEPCASGDVLWGRWAGAENADVVIAGVVTIPGGDVVLGGTFAGTLELGNGARLSAAGARDVVVARLDATGKPRWVRRFGVSGATQEMFALAVEGDAVWLAGSTQGDVDFDGFSLVGAGRDALVVRLAADGAVLFAERFGGGGVERAKAVSPLGANAFAVGGSFTGVLSRQSVALATSDSAVDVDGFVMVVDGAGATSWVAHLGDDTVELLQEVHGLAVSGGALVAAARVDGPATWAGEAVSHVGGSDGVIASFTVLDGAPSLLAQVTGAGVDAAYAVLAAADGIFVAGEFAAPASITGEGGQLCALGDLGGAGDVDGFVAKLGADGCPVWSRALTGAGTDRVVALALGPGGDLALVGHHNGALSFGGAPALDTTTVDDGFAMRVSNAGDLLWARRFGGALRGFGQASVALDDRRLWVAGSYVGTVFFAPTALASAASVDGFVAAFAR